MPEAGGPWAARQVSSGMAFFTDFVITGTVRGADATHAPPEVTGLLGDEFTESRTGRGQLLRCYDLVEVAWEREGDTWRGLYVHHRAGPPARPTVAARRARRRPGPGRIPPRGGRARRRRVPALRPGGQPGRGAGRRGERPGAGDDGTRLVRARSSRRALAVAPGGGARPGPASGRARCGGAGDLGAASAAGGGGRGGAPVVVPVGVVQAAPPGRRRAAVRSRSRCLAGVGALAARLVRGGRGPRP